MRKLGLYSVLLVFLAISFGQAYNLNANANDANPGSSEPRSVVVWLSVDGFRSDYLKRAHTPNMDRLLDTAFYSTQLKPTFPTLTFPSHVTQATGVKADLHGIPANYFFDADTKETYSYPGDPDLLQSEGIWTTAKRQGVRTLVYDWPLSHAQKGSYKSDYFKSHYEQGLSDKERIDLILNTWRQDALKNPEDPLRLVMGYVVGPDSAGHQHGPDSIQMVPVIEAADTVIGEFFDGVKEIFHSYYSEGDRLYVMISTDHGMSPVKYLVNIRNLMGIPAHISLSHYTSGNVGNVFFDKKMSRAQRRELKKQIKENVKEHSFVTLYKKEDLPQKWGYRHSSRVGDLVLVLDNNYTYSGRVRGVKEPVENHGGPLGMHGYDPRGNSEMNGVFVLWTNKSESRTPLGLVRSIELHSLVAEILSVHPAKSAQRTKLTRSVVQ